jgi:hypothetical protein
MLRTFKAMPQMLHFEPGARCHFVKMKQLPPPPPKVNDQSKDELNMHQLKRSAVLPHVAVIMMLPTKSNLRKLLLPLASVNINSFRGHGRFRCTTAGWPTFTAVVKVLLSDRTNGD